MGKIALVVEIACTRAILQKNCFDNVSV